MSRSRPALERVWADSSGFARVGDSGLWLIDGLLTGVQCALLKKSLHEPHVRWARSTVTTSEPVAGSDGAIVDLAVRTCATTLGGVDDVTRTLLLQRLSERGVLRSFLSTNVSDVEMAANRYDSPTPESPGGFFGAHHDAWPNLEPGVRALSVLVYLTTHERGGGTKFPRLGCTVQPREGCAAVWFNSCPKGDGSDEWCLDETMIHRALPLESGDQQKCVINVWVNRSLLNAI